MRSRDPIIGIFIVILIIACHFTITELIPSLSSSQFVSLSFKTTTTTSTTIPSYTNNKKSRPRSSSSQRFVLDRVSSTLSSTSSNDAKIRQDQTLHDLKKIKEWEKIQHLQEIALIKENSRFTMPDPRYASEEIVLKLPFCRNFAIEPCMQWIESVRNARRLQTIRMQKINQTIHENLANNKLAGGTNKLDTTTYRCPRSKFEPITIGFLSEPALLETEQSHSSWWEKINTNIQTSCPVPCEAYQILSNDSPLQYRMSILVTPSHSLPWITLPSPKTTQIITNSPPITNSPTKFFSHDELIAAPTLPTTSPTPEFDPSSRALRILLDISGFTNRRPETVIDQSRIHALQLDSDMVISRSRLSNLWIRDMTGWDCFYDPNKGGSSFLFREQIEPCLPPLPKIKSSQRFGIPTNDVDTGSSSGSAGSNGAAGGNMRNFLVSFADCKPNTFAHKYFLGLIEALRHLQRSGFLPTDRKFNSHGNCHYPNPTSTTSLSELDSSFSSSDVSQGDEEIKKYRTSKGRREEMSKHKFVFICSDDWHHDYFPTHLLEAISSGSVPVIFGSPGAADLIPGGKDSMITALDFSTPMELARHLAEIDKDDPRYLTYFGWRTEQTGKYLNSLFFDMKRYDISNSGKDSIVCRICALFLTTYC
jgi:hypothetical protein